VKTHGEPPTNQVGHPAGSPQVGPEAVRGRLVCQPPQDGSLLPRSQEAGPTGRRPGCQSTVAAAAMPGLPLGDGYRMNAQEVGDRGLSPAGVQLADGHPSPDFQFESRSFASHAGRCTTTPGD